MKEVEDTWVKDMAENLVREIMEQMSGIQLSSVSAPTIGPKDMEGVRIWVDGDYKMQMSFFAERKLFYRFAKNMIEEEPTEEDIRDYAMEFLNIICGRFISELVNQLHIQVRMMAVEYRVLEKWTKPEDINSVRALGFISDTQEYAVFSWTSRAIEEMMKRSQ